MFQIILSFMKVVPDNSISSFKKIIKYSLSRNTKLSRSQSITCPSKGDEEYYKDT